MKFKIGDTVYLKAEIVGFDKSDDTYETCVDGGRRRLWFLDSVFITKEEMLTELQKPEMPNVGEVWQRSNGECVQVVFLSDDNIFFEYKDVSITPGSFPIKVFLARFKKVGYDQ